MKRTKHVNNSGIPDHAIERFARCILDDIRADFAKEEVQKDFARWLAERENKSGKRVDFERNKRSCRNGKIDAF